MSSEISGIRLLFLYYISAQLFSIVYDSKYLHFDIIVKQKKSILSKLHKEFASDIRRAGRGAPRIWILRLVALTYSSSSYSL